MLITDYFVMINFPKTGSSFIRACLREYYENQNRQSSLLKRAARKMHIVSEPKWMDLMLPNIEYAQTEHRAADQHGKVSQIPEGYRSKPVVSATRNPFDRAVSGYEFGWWKNHLHDTVENIKAVVPAFPNLNFSEYLAFMDSQIRHRLPPHALRSDVGIQTVEFFQYYFRDPLRALRDLDDEYIYSGAYKRDMPNITFIRTEKLNEDLYEYLLSLGLKADNIEFIRTKSKVRPGKTERSSDVERSNYWTPELIETRLHKERYLFRIMENNGIIYSGHGAHDEGD
jgi:hypothetical protein